MKIRILDAEAVRQALDVARAIPLMRDAFAQLSDGRAAVPIRTALEMPAHEGRALFMPVYLPGNAQVGLKAVTLHDDNPGYGLPLIHAVMLVLDAVRGHPLALMDGKVLTAIRTGAAAGLATDLLARPGAEVAAVFGAGVQARTQLEAVCAVRPIRRAYVFSRTRTHAEAFSREMSRRLAIDVRVAEAPGRVREADVICTATTAQEPVFAHAALKEGVHINGIGSYRADMAEIPPETVQAATVVVDHRAACLSEAGDLVQPLRDGLITEAHIHAELGEVVLGRKPGRTAADELTLFKSVGNAVQDLAAAGHVLAEAERRGLGTVAPM